jgi:hypothetical protein
LSIFYRERFKMVDNNSMYFSYGNLFNGFNNYSRGCCMQGGFMPYAPLNDGYSRFNQSYYSYPYNTPNIQYSPTVPCFSATGDYSFSEDGEYRSYINPPQLNMRTVSIEEIMD